MIILKHLTVERFRLLREMNLRFPLRGTILVQGPNEAGKSALLESIYFALFGEALNAEAGRRSLDDLIQYGATSATVTLTLTVGTTDLTIIRTLERGKGQQVTLYLQRLGERREEPITRLTAANTRIIAELGLINGETLRNSCLIEQKGLERLERLSSLERESTIRKLLGLERITRLTEHFKVLPRDEQLLKDAAEHLRLAEIQHRIPEISQQLDLIEEALDVVTICEDLDEVQRQEDEIAEQQRAKLRVQEQRSTLKLTQGRIQQLKRADATLADIIAAYDTIADARLRIPELERQIAELERREREELPALEKRVTSLVELTQLFGTLQRMSNDLLTSVDAIKDLEQDLKQHDALNDTLKHLSEQVAQARSRLEQSQQSLRDLEEHRDSARPVLESRLLRLKTLMERLAVLRQLEDQYNRHVTGKGLAEENEAQLRKVRRELQETEQELTLVENEAKQTQKHAEALEKHWRQLSIRRQLEEWVRLEGMTHGLVEAEHHVRLAYQQQEQLTLAALEAKRNTTKYMGLVAGCGLLFLFCLIAAIFQAMQRGPFAFAFVGVAILLLVIGVGWTFRYYRKACEKQQVADRQMQEAVSRVRMMVAAREAAARASTSTDTLAQVEHEIRSLGGTVPRSVEEAQRLLAQMRDQDDSLADVQKRMQEKRDEASAARNQLNVTMEAVALLRKERARLEEQRSREGWDNIEENLRSDEAALERMHQEITVLAGQEGLPLLSVNARLQEPVPQNTLSAGPITPILRGEDLTGVPDLDTLVDATIKSTERELATLDGKLELAANLKAQIKSYESELNDLLQREQQLHERASEYEMSNPLQQIERAREQQGALRTALQGLQESLRQRVKPLGVAFGQTAIATAEVAARKQLEELHMALGSKMKLQENHESYVALLKERQESLAEHYKQLAKFSNSLGSWIVPPNPFSDALALLRTRCQQELEEANEPKVLKEFEKLQAQEEACAAKMALCRREIGEAHERIATMLVQRNRAQPRSFTRADIITVWPLLAKYTTEDRERLEKERDALEQELAQFEDQELTMSKQLQTHGATIDLEQARSRMEQQERAYQTKKYGNQLVKAVNERLMQKIIPRTEFYMQQLLPLLTEGRYHDVHLLTEPEEGASSGGSLRLRVWDTAAGEYVSKAALSGGAADQLSLALRLAFAIATLPQELNAAPGFILVDEPLSSFDHGRARSLASVFTGDALTQHFEQIILISHSSAFEPAMFPYHVYMDNGLIVESNLPVAPALTLPNLDEDEEDRTIQIAALPTSLSS